MKKDVLVLNKVVNIEPIDEEALSPLADKIQAHWYQRPEPYFSLDDALTLFPAPQVIVTSLVGLSRRTLQKCPTLEAVFATSTAVDYIDLSYCRENKIPVFNTPRYTGPAVAEHAIALMMASAKHLRRLDEQLRAGQAKVPPFAMELFGKRVGIIGLGDIGARVATYAKCFGMEVVYYNRSLKPFAAATQVDLDTLLSSADMVVMTVPLNKETFHLIGKHELSLMKRSSFLINIGADELIQSDELVEALKRGEIAGAGLDVISEYDVYLDAPNLIMTQSRGWYTAECAARRVATWVETLKHYLDDKPINNHIDQTSTKASAGLLLCPHT
jgi:phosphoglycerate dehydrogenase-like enzyme